MSNTAPPNKPRAKPILLTPGEPAGIGPDLALTLALERQPVPVVSVAAPGLMQSRARELGLALEIRPLSSLDEARPSAAGVSQVLAIETAVPVKAGTLDPRNSAYVLACLDRASDECLAGNATAMVTGPVNKAVINDAGVAFSGHTEYLAERLGAPLPVMLLAAGSLRVALLTTHVPLSEVPAMITEQLIATVLDIVDRDLRRQFGLRDVRMAICGLNPHAGEQGHLGHEEQTIIRPAVDKLNAQGLNITGPIPADTAFTRSERSRYDVLIALYHDQGLTALKALSFGDAVNITLGLPIVRTSVDHGTALDLAGSGNADPASFRAALALARELGHAASMTVDA